MLLIAVAAVWGASFLSAKELTGEVGVAPAVALRFLVAASALGVICLIRRERMPRGRGLAIAALLGCSQAAIIGLGIAYSAYQAENFRAGIEAVDRGQVEAALSIGMGWGMTMRRVILPQAIRDCLPPYCDILAVMF